MDKRLLEDETSSTVGEDVASRAMKREKMVANGGGRFGSLEASFLVAPVRCVHSNCVHDYVRGGCVLNVMGSDDLFSGGKFMEWDSHGELLESYETSNDRDEEMVDLSYVINITEEEVRSNITNSVVEKFKSLDDAIVQVNCPQKIQKVPSILRDNNNFTKHYVPRMIAIGPYHHNNPNLKNTEKLKLKLASLFIKKHTLNREVLYSKVRREIKDLRECYEEEATALFPDDDYLAWMFFVDGCALLHYIDFAVTDKEDTMIKEFKEKGIKIDYLVYAQQDLFLLENQLPYRVLVSLISCMGNQMPMKLSIEKFIFGIRLRPSGTGCLRDITFNLGTLRLPSIQVDDSTASKFLNLIAYEMCPDFLNDFGVSSYVAFLDILIDQAQDVKELRDKQILHNFLGSDEEVAKLFNEIGTDLVSNPNIYRDVKSKIQRRYDNKLMTSMAQFIHEYFRSPWSAIAFLAAIIALASTVAQTVYTIWFLCVRKGSKDPYRVGIAAYNEDRSWEGRWLPKETGFSVAVAVVLFV
ncbi:uncharacterized protein LOC116129182 [Pistacia vera]|uniref:uncharacterized protein LOC116129182 n=1 Tax=Pistacia vera TaxID=55513 RepID=UPI001262D1E0|nr:uncharacterized protein LOC116129182 [Pistacia vera]